MQQKITMFAPIVLAEGAEGAETEAEEYKM